jgi:hypothetical protein
MRSEPAEEVFSHKDFWVPHCGSPRASAGQLKQVVTEAGFATPETQLSLLAQRT